MQQWHAKPDTNQELHSATHAGKSNHSETEFGTKGSDSGLINYLLRGVSNESISLDSHLQWSKGHAVLLGLLHKFHLIEIFQCPSPNFAKADISLGQTM